MRLSPSLIGKERAMRYLSSGDIADIIGPMAGVTAAQFAGWCDRGLIVPAEGGGARGEHRRFTATQAVGIAVAAKVFASERSCSSSYVGLLVAAFGRLSEAELVAKIGRRATHLLGVCSTAEGGPHLILDGPASDRVDVLATYREVTGRIDRLARMPANQTGRSRGLAGANRGG